MRILYFSITIIFSLIYFQIFGQQKQDSFTIVASLSGFKDSSKFYLVNLDSTQHIDSAYMKKGRLIFRGKVLEPVTFRIYPENDNIYFNLWVENKNMTITGDRNNFFDLKVTGSPLNQIYFSVLQTHLKLDKIRDSLTTVAMKETDESKIGEIWKKISGVDDEVLRIRLKNISSFKPSLITIKELYFLRNDLTNDSLKLLFNRFPPTLKKTKYGDVIKQYIFTKEVKVGSHAPEISGKTLSGKEVKLSDFKGKVILLDFWASWCGPCRKNNNALANIYQKFGRSNFEIISFSIDTNLEDWKESSDKDKISWINISDLNGSYSKQAASYKIRSIPQSILIDQNGIIIEIFSGFGMDMESVLEERILKLTK